jgi:short-subunit dehydrogenase
MDTNVTGTLRAWQIFGKHMLERGYGCILNLLTNRSTCLAQLATHLFSLPVSI